MSVEYLSIVLHHSRSVGTDKVVLLGIANHAGDGGAWPSVATLARYANVTTRSVQRSVDNLIRSGEVVVYQQQGGSAHMKNHERPNRYDVTVSCPPNCDRSPQHRLTPLPSAQADLWTDRVTPTSPGDAHVTGGVTPTSPGGVTPTSPEPSMNHPMNNAGSASTTGRARVPACQTCGLAADECQRRAATNGHDYTPRSETR